MFFGFGKRAHVRVLQRCLQFGSEATRRLPQRCFRAPANKVRKASAALHHPTAKARAQAVANASRAGAEGVTEDVQLAAPVLKADSWHRAADCGSPPQCQFQTVEAGVRSLVAPA